MEKENAIVLKNLTVAYNASPVLWDVSITFEKGRLTAIVGPNGAGKSTLVKSMLNLLKPVAGEVEFTVGGQSSNRYNEVKNHIAYVPQVNNVDWDFPATVLDVVVMGRYGHLGWFKRPKKKDYELARQTLVKVGLPTFSERQISQLSGGQRQRVFLARALVQEADMYIMDEPFAGVDMKTERIIIQLLKELKEQGKSIIVVHHDLQTVEDYFDDIVFINREVIANGSIETVFNEANINETYRTDHNLGEGNDV